MKRLGLISAMSMGLAGIAQAQNFDINSCKPSGDAYTCTHPNGMEFELSAQNYTLMSMAIAQGAEIELSDDVFGAKETATRREETQPPSPDKAASAASTASVTAAPSVPATTPVAPEPEPAASGALPNFGGNTEEDLLGFLYKIVEIDMRRWPMTRAVNGSLKNPEVFLEPSRNLVIVELDLKISNFVGQEESRFLVAFADGKMVCTQGRWEADCKDAFYSDRLTEFHHISFFGPNAEPQFMMGPAVPGTQRQPQRDEPFCQIERIGGVVQQVCQ